MNLAIRGIEGQIAHGDSFHNDQHPDLKASFILANPAFNVKDWGGDRPSDDQRWQYDVPPKGNANLVEPRARRPSEPTCSAGPRGRASHQPKRSHGTDREVVRTRLPRRIAPRTVAIAG